MLLFHNFLFNYFKGLLYYNNFLIDTCIQPPILISLALHLTSSKFLTKDIFLHSNLPISILIFPLPATCKEWVPSLTFVIAPSFLSK